MKKIFPLIFLLILSILSNAQSMESIFLLLHGDCMELNAEQRKMLLKDEEYILPDGDSIEATKYTIEVDEANKYLSYEFSFTTGQRGFNVHQVRKFKKTDGNYLILYSRYGGLPAAFQQIDLYAFEFKNDKLLRLKDNLLPETINGSLFAKPNTPDSIRQRIEKWPSYCYNLFPDAKNGLTYRIHFAFIDEETEKYLLNDEILFTWTGKSFRQEKVMPFKNNDSPE